MPEPRFRDRVANAILGRRDAESGQRSGGVAGLFRGGNGQVMLNPISAFGDRVGRRVAGRVNDWNTNRLENRHRQELIEQESAGRPVMATNRMPGPVPVPNPSRYAEPSGRELTDAEIQQQRDQFDRYRNDPNSIYYQGPRFDQMGPRDTIVGPNASQHRSPTRELFNATDIRTGSGQAFNDAVRYYGSLQKPNRNFER